MEILRRVQPALAVLLRPPDGSSRPSLAALSATARLSRYHFHRMFVAATGETTKQFELRVRTARAAAEMLHSRKSILSIAVAHGFASHETYIRAFRRRFGRAPREYRRRGLTGMSGPAAAVAAARNAAVVAGAAPCLRLYRLMPATRRDRIGPDEQEHTAMPQKISVVDAALQHTLVIKRRVAPDQVGEELARLLPAVFGYAQEIGAPMAGAPLVRYLETSVGSTLIEAGVPVTVACPGRGEIAPSTVGGQRVATTIHAGAYERLGDTHREIEAWMELEGRRPAGAPWEQYLTDPAETPDVANWETAIFWPVTDPAGVPGEPLPEAIRPGQEQSSD